MKNVIAKEFLEKLRNDVYIDSNLLKKVLNFSDKVLEKLNTINNIFKFRELFPLLVLYNNDDERLEVLNICSNEILRSDKYEYVIDILGNKTLIANNLSFKHAKIFIQNSTINNQDILYQFLTDEFIIKNNLVNQYLDVISNILNANKESILNIIKEKYNDRYINEYIYFVDYPIKFVANCAYYFIMHNTFDNPEDNILMAEMMEYFYLVDNKEEFVKVIFNNKELFIDIIKENKETLRCMFPDKKQCVCEFFKIVNNNYTKEEINKCIRIIDKYYSSEDNNKTLMNVLINKKFKEFEIMDNLKLKNKEDNILSIVLLQDNLFNKVINIITIYHDIPSILMDSITKYQNKYISEKELEYIINLVKQMIDDKCIYDEFIYNAIEIVTNGHLINENLNIEYANLYLNEKSRLKKELYKEIMLEYDFIYYREELINILKNVNDYILLILKKYIERLTKENKKPFIIDLCKIIIEYGQEEKNYIKYEEKCNSLINLVDEISIVHSEVDKEKEQNLRKYIIDRLIGLNVDNQFLEDNYDLIYQRLYYALVSGSYCHSREYFNIDRCQEIIKESFNMNINNPDEEVVIKNKLIDDLIKTIESNEENIRKLIK